MFLMIYEYRIVGPTTKDKRLVIFPATCKRNDMLILTIQPTSQKAYQWNINLSVLFGAASTTGSLMLQTNPNQRLKITAFYVMNWNTAFRKHTHNKDLRSSSGQTLFTSIRMVIFKKMLVNYK